MPGFRKKKTNVIMPTFVAQKQRIIVHPNLKHNIISLMKGRRLNIINFEEIFKTMTKHLQTRNLFSKFSQNSSTHE